MQKKELLAELKLLKKDLFVFQEMKERDQLLDSTWQEKKQALTQKAIRFDLLADELGLKSKLHDSLQSCHFRLLRLTRGVRNKVWFRVQVGGYLKHPIDRFNRVCRAFEIDRTPSGLRRYMIGYFYSYQEARSLKDWLLRHGGNAYVVGYKNGYRLRVLSSWID
ncbi:MAG: hypothetical protein AAFU64_08415 [Bacteroidota bacterium]